MDKNGNITISKWTEGTAATAVLGNEAIIGCEIFEEPGILKINNAPSADGSQVNNPSYVTLTGMPVADVTNYNSVQATQRTVLTESGQLFSISNADFLMASNLSKGWDACVWNTEFTVISYSQSGVGYIGVIYHDPTTNSASWFPAKIGSLDGYHNIKLCMGRDGYMYFTNGNNLGRITAISYSAGSVTLSSISTMSTFVLPRNTFGVTLETLGDKLIIGTQKGPTFSTRSDYAYAGIVVWDYVSANPDNEIRIKENGINAMIQKDNVLYFSAGIDGNIYETDGASYRIIKNIPFTKIKKFGATCNVYPNAMTVSQQNTLLVGTSTYTDSYPGSSSTHGVWEISLTRGYPIHLPYVSANGNLGSSESLHIGVVRTLDSDAVSFGVDSGSSYYKLLTTTYSLNTSYGARFDTPIYWVGTKQNRKSFNNIEFTLSKELETGQGIRISYRKNINDLFTVIGTWDYSTLGAVMSHYSKALIADAEMVQLRIELTQSAGVFGDNVNLLRVILS